MTIDEIRKLIEVVRETGISELEVQLGDNRVRIRVAGPANQEIVLPPVLPIAVSSTSPLSVASAAISPAAAPSPPEPPSPPERADDAGLVVKSPIVGTYYDAPAPGEPPFIRVGDRVEPKQVLCIIESMKLMNEIEADIAGIVVAKHVENGRPVEYGESLFTVRPL